MTAPAPLQATPPACVAQGGFISTSTCTQASCASARFRRMPRRQNRCLDLYTWPTPNGHKVRVSCVRGTRCRVQRDSVRHLGSGSNSRRTSCVSAPTSKMPALVDHDGSGRRADLDLRVRGDPALRLAETHRRLLPDHPRGRWEVMQWLMFQMSRGRTVPRAGASLPRLCAREDHVRDRPLHERGEAALPRARRAPRGSRVPRGRVLHRGHCDVPVGFARTNARGRRSPTSPTWSDGSALIDRRPAVERGVQGARPIGAATGPLSAEARENMFGAKQYATLE